MQDLLIEIQGEPEAPVKDEACMLEANFKVFSLVSSYWREALF